MPNKIDKATGNISSPAENKLKNMPKTSYADQVKIKPLPQKNCNQPATDK